MEENSTDLSSLLAINTLKGRPLSEQVYENLKEKIIKGHLEDGMRLQETEVARLMGVSPTPVREAFRRLATEGLVEIIPWRGARVRSVTEKDRLETYQCREVLEGLACRLAAESIDAKGLRRLQRLVKEASEAGTAPEVVNLNSAIHNMILEYAGNAKLRSTLGLFHEAIIRDREYTAYNAERRKAIQTEHEAILAALEKRDGEAAERSMRIHVRNGYAYLRKEKEDKR